MIKHKHAVLAALTGTRAASFAQTTSDAPATSASAGGRFVLRLVVAMV